MRLVPTDRTMGNPNAKVVLIEYGAPSCPVCANFNAQTFPELKAKYIDTGKIFYVFRVFPLRPTTARPRKSPAACLRISTSRSLTCCSRINPNGTLSMEFSHLRGFMMVWFFWGASPA